MVQTGDYTLKFNTDGGPGQDGWRHCRLCEGLFFFDSSRPNSSNCPLTSGASPHDPNTGIYRIAFAPTVVPHGQRNWRWCKRCEGMWFNGHDDNGRCPATLGEGHINEDSADYILSVVPMQR